MAKLLKKLKATTLVETLVAMTIISVVAGLAMVIFWQVSTPGSSTRELLLAQQKSAEIMAELEDNDLARAVSGEAVLIENLSFEQHQLQLQSDLYQVEIDVFDNSGKLIYTRQRLFYVPPNTK